MIEYIDNEIMAARLRVNFLTPITEDQISEYEHEDMTIYATMEMDPLLEFYFHGAYDPDLTYAVPTKLRNYK